ncbi:MAG: acyl-CoA dehydrogenase family protein [Woeseiaceae bacterium]|nr:acyl-CoA dehydrogenase family protein [Woeseiaceae bacterium]
MSDGGAPESFTQAEPELGNTFASDLLLQSVLQRKLPDPVYRRVCDEFLALGERMAGDVLAMSEEVDRNPPSHVPFAPNGKRIDHIQVSPAWNALDRVSAEEGMIATAYERAFDDLSRPLQWAKLYLFHPSSSYYTCPLAMTDGAAKLIERFGDSQMFDEVFAHLTSRNPDEFWTSGQWMTEKRGGSDVAGSETIARMQHGEWRLYGDKWFTSATTAQIAMTLARVEDETGRVVPGSRGLSLFFVRLRDDSGRLQNIEILRLKDKLGTRSMPTAELRLAGTPATMLGAQGQGVKSIATLFNVTRIDNAAAAVGTARRMLDLALDYATKRKAFGKSLSEHPLHVETLADLETEFHGAFHLGMYVSTLLGREECFAAWQERAAASEGYAGIIDQADNAALLRFFTPLAKLYTAKQNLRICSEVVESFGGYGYVEDSGLPKHLRDAQVLAIWEGTTNILSLDLLRAIARESAFPVFVEDTRARLETVTQQDLASARDAALQALERCRSFLDAALNAGGDTLEIAARQFAYRCARVAIAALLLEHAQITGNSRLSLVARRWCESRLGGLELPSPGRAQESAQIAFSA